MKSSTLTLAYLNEDDRAYGLAGMAISLAAFNAMDRVSEVSLDITDGPMVTFANAYYFSGSPSISPKSTWRNLIDNYRITSAMAIANLMSRSMVRLKQEVPQDLLSALHDSIVAEGRETCSLEDDEIEELYSGTMAYSRRIFANPRLHPAIDQFARILARRRTLSGREINDELHLLQLI